MPDHVWSADKELIANAMETRDADFIANAPTDIAKLLELVQVYETALEQVKSVTGTSTLQWHAADKALTAGAKIKGDET